MANGFSVTDDDPTGPAGVSAPPGAGPGGPPPGGPPPGGNPLQPGGGGGILAALSRAQHGPQVSAPGPGNQADAMNQISQALQLIQHAALSLPPGSPIHGDALKAATMLSKHLGQGFAGPALGTQKTMLGDMLRRTIQNAMQQRIMSQQGQAQPGQEPGGAPMMPSTPLPGA